MNKIQFQKRSNIIAALMCAAGIALNMVTSSLVTALGLPIYLDTVGTITVALLGGYLPGVIVGFITNLIKTITDPSSLYYGALNVLIGIFAAFFAHKGWHKKIAGIFGMVGVFALIGGGLGALIPWFMEGLSFDSESLSGIIYETGFFNLEISHLLSSLITDLPDKAISVAIAVLMVRLIPEKYHFIFRMTGWQQTGALEEDYLDEDRTGVRVISMQKKILIALSLALLTVSIVAMGIGTSVYNKTIINDHMRIAQGTVNIVATVLDGDRIDKFLESKGTAPGYDETQKKLEEILKNSADICFLYVYKIEEDGSRVVFDVDSRGIAAQEVGLQIPHDTGMAGHIEDFLEGKEVDPVITNDRYGYLLTAYKPVFNSKGQCVCYVGADVDMIRLRDMRLSFSVEMASVFLAFFFFMCTLVIWVAEYGIILPINSIMRCMDRISHTSDTQEGMDEDVKMFRKLGIHTGDELENLYLSACSMTRNQAEQMRNIRRLSESTAKMQDGLIITMADLVESRDSDTGAHVQKTAAYVKIIVEGLKRKGYYSEKITDKFISDVVRSAPLHDIGKINIPDEVLNKKGKLSPEEFEIMKTHASAGKRIMENAISTVEGDNYLKEARNMAAYHHERWDGNGYPEGIHGEVIPLSARIMAVADVFDALTSKRVYKPAFPIDKALSIMEEGKGTQFDPKCIEVFMESLPEVKVVLRKYNKDA